MAISRPGVFLYPGDYHFDRKGSCLRTLLGSCVAITLWHPRLRIGGMCHFLLPGRLRTPSMPFDGKYADEALALLAEEMAAAGPQDELCAYRSGILPHGTRRRAQ